MTAELRSLLARCQQALRDGEVAFGRRSDCRLAASRNEKAIVKLAYAIESQCASNIGCAGTSSDPLFPRVAAGVGWSRVYVGVHWATDVIAGWLAAACWVALVAWLAHTRRTSE